MNSDTWTSIGIFIGGGEQIFLGEQKINVSIMRFMTQNVNILTKCLTKWPNPGGAFAPLLPFGRPCSDKQKMKWSMLNGMENEAIWGRFKVHRDSWSWRKSVTDVK